MNSCRNGPQLTSDLAYDYKNASLYKLKSVDKASRYGLIAFG